MAVKILIFITWFFSACFVFSGMVIFVFRSGIVRESRDEKAVFRKKMSWKGLLPLIIFPLLVMAMLMVFDYSMYRNSTAGFLPLVLWNLALVFALTLYDSFVIDLLVIGKLRPAFLGLPEKMDMQAMKVHVKKTFITGWVFIVPLSVLPAVFYFIVQ